MKKILIFGDSFAADWSVKYIEYKGWPNLLQEQFDVTNIAQAGVSEFKIYKQLLTVNVADYDIFIVSHTSPYRIPVRKHPVHHLDSLHSNADLIYTDIEFHSNRLKNIFNFPLRTAINFYKHLYDEEFYTLTYNMLRDKINDILTNKRVICVSNFHNKYEYYEQNCLDFSYLYPKYKGTVNHFSEEGNRIIFGKILSEIN
jgi:hypothetical protein